MQVGVRRNPVAIERRRRATALPHGYERHRASDLHRLAKALAVTGFSMLSTIQRTSISLFFVAASLVLAVSCRSVDSSKRASASLPREPIGGDAGATRAGAQDGLGSVYPATVTPHPLAV